MNTDLTPLGDLFEAARQAKRPKLSQNAAALAAGTSSTTYRRIINGVSRFGGQDIPFDGSADTVASIARVLGITPEQLEGVGRGDAAEELRALERAGSGRSVMDMAEAQLAENERKAAALNGGKAAALAERIARLSPRKREAVEQMIEALEDEPPSPEPR